MPARYIGSVTVEGPEGDALMARFEVTLPADAVDSAATEARARIAAGQSPPRTLAAAAHTLAADIIDAAVDAGLGS